ERNEEREEQTKRWRGRRKSETKMITARAEAEGPRAGTTPAKTGAKTEIRTMTMAIDDPTKPARTRYCGSTSRSRSPMAIPAASATKMMVPPTSKLSNSP